MTKWLSWAICKNWLRALLALLIVIVGSSCATSPLGRKQLTLVPDSQMDAMGTKAFEQMKAETPIERSPQLNSFVQCVAVPLTQAAQGQMNVDKWDIVVFKEDKTVNAFALPGGKIGVYTGLLKVAKNDAQLAAVVGHEIGHVIARHGNERTSQALATQGGLALVQAFIQGQLSNPTQTQLLMAALGIGAQVGILLPFGRTQESESDLIGLDLMARAGFQPEESVELWKNMSKASGGKAPPQWLSTHPANEARIANLNSHMAGATQKYQQAQAQRHRPNCGPVPAI